MQTLFSSYSCQPSLVRVAFALVAVIATVSIVGCSSSAPLGSPLATPDWQATKRAFALTPEVRMTDDPNAVATAYALATEMMATASAETPEPTVFATIPGTPAGAGTIVVGVGPFSPIDYYIENRWYEDTDGGSTRTSVWAGAVAEAGGERSQKGIVLVQVTRRYPQDNDTRTALVEFTSRLTPCQGGPVRVVDAVGEVLTLLSASGHTFTFDVPARQFLPPPGATPTPTPNPATDWVFTGRVDTGTTDPPPCATITLYRQAGSTWQPLAQTTPSAEGTFSLRAPGPRPPSRFLLSVQYPPGFAPALPVAGPGFVVVDNHTILSVSALGPGEYGGQRFRTTHILHYDQMPHPPGTPTPPPLPPPPPGTWTPPPPTLVSPLPTPTPE